jgi:hypothetical protein
MNIIIETIEREIDNQDVCFVFPSAIAAERWPRKVCTLGIRRSVAADRFLAWDTFKEKVICEETKDREPASAVMRRLFTEALVKENAEAAKAAGVSARVRGPSGFPLLSVIPPEYAGDGSLYAASIAGVLPSLEMLENLQKGPSYRSREEDGEEDRDFEVIKERYAEFLNRYNLFEPSWEMPRYKDRGHEYYIFFPEGIEDFSEYEAVLKKVPSVHLISTGEVRNGDTENILLREYESCRGEIRALLLEIRRLYDEEHIPWEEMAVSVPELEELEPYLLREFDLYNVPYRRRSGRPLGKSGAGRLFSLLGECADSDFSFRAFKSLLLESRLPWTSPGINRQLILFGIRKNCVSSYIEEGRPVNIWDEAFNTEAFNTEERNGELKRYYRGLKKIITAMAGAKTFDEIRNHYFALWGGFLDREKCPKESDDILSRCIIELSDLAGIERRYPELTPAKPYKFFLSIINGVQYVPRQEERGVNIFRYRVAAAAPFRRHFVINASQKAASVVYRPLGFFRQDKRNRLGLKDYDASGDFFTLYRAGLTEACTPWISSSTEALSGYSIPHNFFSGCTQKAVPPVKGDSLIEEKIWWASGGEEDFPQKIFPVQKQGFEYWASLVRAGTENFFDFLAEPFQENSPQAELLKNKIRAVQWTQGESVPMLKISATDLNTFFECPLLWFYNEIFAIEPFSLEAQLLDDVSLGNLYHEILRNLFTRIQREDGVFRTAALEKYKTWAFECTVEAAENFQAFEGPLAAPLISAQAKAIAKKISRLLETEAVCFPEYAVGVLEQKLETTVELSSGPALLRGIVDRVSISPYDDPVIIDYKTGGTPTKTESTKTKDKGIKNFQIPAYVKLWEYSAEKNIKVKGAFFMSINKNELTAVIGKPGGKRGHTRDEYQETIDSLGAYFEEYAAVLSSPDFSKIEKHFGKCVSCPCKKICRTAYALNARLYAARGEETNEE